MNAILALMIFSLSTLSFANCDVFLEESNTCVAYQWTKGPFLNSGAERNFSELEVRFFDADDATETAIPKEEVEILPWMIMPNMQHGTRPVITTELANGNYLVTEIFLRKMMGWWEIRFVNSSDESVLGSFKVQE
ncbi:FixH family protein [Halobacteriovorax sp. JY17]|uniref:FixH family protein n=1 Tax=Halobacteriovorax sp. JY17 TaxID=2014617 RepID=UPI000C3F4029|nr:FixH family protein [Halobacteriovorax sp. JY17]PIK15020.1 MAG: hypothetical protein CES88_11850 [Halobacteriovorax sp. JY17]